MLKSGFFSISTRSFLERADSLYLRSRKVSESSSFFASVLVQWIRYNNFRKKKTEPKYRHDPINEEVVKSELRELVRNSVEETLNELLNKEAEELTNAAKCERTETS